MRTYGFTIEGECLVGKSTALKMIKAKENYSGADVFLVPEYFEIGKLSSTSRRDRCDVKRIQDEIMSMEKRRSEIAARYLAVDRNSVVGFDRSFLSCLSYEQAVKQTGGMDGFDYLLDLYRREYLDGNVVLPSQVIHLSAELTTIEYHRQNLLGAGHNDIPPFLQDLRVRRIQNQFTEIKGRELYGEAYFRLSIDNLSSDIVANMCCVHISSAIKIDSINLGYQYA